MLRRWNQPEVGWLLKSTSACVRVSPTKACSNWFIRALGVSQVCREVRFFMAFPWSPRQCNRFGVVKVHSLWCCHRWHASGGTFCLSSRGGHIPRVGVRSMGNARIHVHPPETRSQTRMSSPASYYRPFLRLRIWHSSAPCYRV